MISNELISTEEYLAQRQKVDGMNKLEKDYADFLWGLQKSGIVTSYHYEAIKLRLAKNTYYHPDFLVQHSTGRIEVHEVKGYWRDDARVKWKTCAEKFPMFKFVAVTRVRRVWCFEEYGVRVDESLGHLNCIWRRKRLMVPPAKGLR